MTLLRKDVAHMAHLSRITLTEGEKEKFADELSAILAFVEKLGAADTAAIAPLTGETELTNALRPDEPVSQDLEGKQTTLVAAAPEKKDGWIRVKKVFADLNK